MRGQYEELPCPFCDKGVIQAWLIPRSYSIKQARSRVLRGNQIQRNPETWIIKTGCSVCNKSQDDVEKELRRKNII